MGRSWDSGPPWMDSRTGWGPGRRASMRARSRRRAARRERIQRQPCETNRRGASARRLLGRRCHQDPRTPLRRPIRDLSVAWLLCIIWQPPARVGARTALSDGLSAPSSYNRITGPCAEPATRRVTDAERTGSIAPPQPGLKILALQAQEEATRHAIGRSAPGPYLMGDRRRAVPFIIPVLLKPLFDAFGVGVVAAPVRVDPGSGEAAAVGAEDALVVGRGAPIPGPDGEGVAL